MEPAIVIITLICMVLPFLIMLIVKGFQKTYRNAKKKFSDRELLALLIEEGNVLSVKQIAALSPLTYSEVSVRVSTWVNNGVLRQLSSNDGWVMYQLKPKMFNTDRV